MALKLSERPSFAGGNAKIELTFVVPPPATHDRQIVAPGQFSQQWCEFWLVPVGLEELTHPPEVSCGISAHAGVSSANCVRQGFDGSLAPAVFCDLPRDILADGPVEVDQCGVDGGQRPRSRGLDQAQDLVKVGLGRLHCARLRGQVLPFGLLRRTCSCRLRSLRQKMIQVILLVYQTPCVFESGVDHRATLHRPLFQC